MLRNASCILALVSWPVLGQTTGPVAADDVSPATQATTAPSDEVAALQKQVDELRAEIVRLRASQPQAAAQPQAVRAETLPPRAEAVVAPQVIAPRPGGANIAPGTSTDNVAVSDVIVTDLRQDGKPGLSVAANVTLKHVPNVPLVFQAALVTPDGNIHTNVRGKPYTATREVRTGDDIDMDDYSVWLDLSDLFSSRPPADLGVQVRVLDQAGNPIAASQLHGFKRPWR